MLAIYQNLFAPPRHLIILVGAAWIGLLLAEKRSGNHGVSERHLNNLVFYSLLGFLLGGRLVYVFEHLTVFASSPLGMISINPDLFDFTGALVVAFLAGWIYSQRFDLPAWSAMDALTPYLATLVIGISLSDLASGDGFGKPTDLPWGIYLWNSVRHPTQIYEAIAGLLTFLLVWLHPSFRTPITGKTTRTRDEVHPAGMQFLVFTALTSGWMLFLGAYRGNSRSIIWGLRMEQVISWGILTITFIAIDRLASNPKLKN